MQITRHFAGLDRAFELRLGDLADIERAADASVGEIYLRLSQLRFFVRDLKAVIVTALVRGGMERPKAERLFDEKAEDGGLLECQTVAMDIMVAAMSGITPDATAESGGEPAKMDLGKLFAAFAPLGIGPDTVRDWRFADFVNMVRAMGSDTPDAPSREEFEAMKAKFGGAA